MDNGYSRGGGGGGGGIALLTMGYMRALSETELQDVLTWVDQIPLSREKKNLTRDFSDGVTMAEIIKYFLPKYVEMHQFSPANNSKTKEQNWFHLNRGVLAKLGLQLDSEVVHALAQCRPWVVENVLIVVRDRIESHQQTTTGRSTINSFRAGDASLGQPPTRTQSPPKRSDIIHQTFDKHQKQIVEKQEKIIESLTAKIKKLEQIIEIKDSRIKDLEGRLIRAGYNPDEPVNMTSYGGKKSKSLTNREPTTHRK